MKFKKVKCIRKETSAIYLSIGKEKIKKLPRFFYADIIIDKVKERKKQ